MKFLSFEMSPSQLLKKLRKIHSYSGSSEESSEGSFAASAALGTNSC